MSDTTIHTIDSGARSASTDYYADDDYGSSSSTFVVSSEFVGWCVAQPPKPRYVVEIAPMLRHESPTRPNAWHRLWQRLLLGWKWSES